MEKTTLLDMLTSNHTLFEKVLVQVSEEKIEQQGYVNSINLYFSLNALRHDHLFKHLSI